MLKPIDYWERDLVIVLGILGSAFIFLTWFFASNDWCSGSVSLANGSAFICNYIGSDFAWGFIAANLLMLWGLECLFYARNIRQFVRLIILLLYCGAIFYVFSLRLWDAQFFVRSR